MERFNLHTWGPVVTHLSRLQHCPGFLFPLSIIEMRREVQRGLCYIGANTKSHVCCIKWWILVLYYEAYYKIVTFYYFTTTFQKSLVGHMGVLQGCCPPLWVTVENCSVLSGRSAASMYYYWYVHIPHFADWGHWPKQASPYTTWGEIETVGDWEREREGELRREA